MNDKKKMEAIEKKLTDQKITQDFYKAAETRIKGKPSPADFYCRAGLPKAPESWAQDFYRLR